MVKSIFGLSTLYMGMQSPVCLNTHLAGNFSKMASKRPRSSLKSHFDSSKKSKSGTNGEPDEGNGDGGFVDGAIVRVKMRNFV